MDIFKFTHPTETRLERGEIIDNIRSKMWVERYRTAGEFQLKAYVNTGIRERLPIGTIISHVDTTEAMIVENHEITDQRGQEPEIVITGRGFESFLDTRVVGSNKTLPTTGPLTEYTLPSAYSWLQAKDLIEDHIYASKLLDDDNALLFTTVQTDVSGTSVAAERVVKRGSLYTRLLELLEFDDLGIRVTRPGPWSPLGAASSDMVITIHAGQNLTNDIVFSHATGEIESAAYLWSNKKLRNCALVSGRWLETLVDSAATNYDRRMMYVEAADIDNSYPSEPTGADRTAVLNAMQQRGQEALAAQNEVALTNAEVSRNAIKAVYRVDYNVGDIITVHGDYDESSIRRISEYVEIEDETGQSGYPTLAMI